MRAPVYARLNLNNQMRAVLTRLSLVILSLFLTSLSAHAQTPRLVSQKLFTSLIASAYEDAAGGEACVAGLHDDQFRFGPTEADCNHVFRAEAAYQGYAAAPDRLDAMLDQIGADLAAAADVETPLPLAEQLLVQVRPAARNTVSQTFMGDLQKVLMREEGNRLYYVSEEEIAEAGLSVDEAFALATNNLRGRLGPVRAQEMRSVTLLAADSGLVTGALALQGICQASAPDRLYFAYDRNGLMMVDSSNALGVSNLLSVARDMTGEGSALSNSVLRCSKGEWSEYANLLREETAVTGKTARFPD